MVQITIISVGTLKENYLKDAISEYKKRLSQYARIEEINLKEELIKNEEDKSQIEKALSLEGEKILSRIPKEAYAVAMCVEGKEYDSPALAKFIDTASKKSGKIAFIIGSSHGLANSVKYAADAKLSLSPLTFPHQLLRVILSEALYRSFTILDGKKYHK